MSTTTTSRNEAADRIRNYDGQYGHPLAALVDEALATERRNLIEQAKERLHAGGWTDEWSVDFILDDLSGSND